MGKYTIKDFKIGGAVYHITNEYLIMAITDMNIDENKISCRWLDSDGKVQSFLRVKYFSSTPYPFSMVFENKYGHLSSSLLKILAAAPSHKFISREILGKTLQNSLNFFI